MTRLCSRAVPPLVPQDLAELFGAKRRAGLVAAHGSGYGGSGFKFNTEEQDKAKQVGGQSVTEDSWQVMSLTLLPPIAFVLDRPAT